MPSPVPALVPEALVAQLKVGGRMFIPVGGADSQTILLVTRTGPQAQQYEAVPLMPVRYVPLVKKNGPPSPMNCDTSK